MVIILELILLATKSMEVMEIIELIEDDETENIEFKTSLSKINEILKPYLLFPIKEAEPSLWV